MTMREPASVKFTSRASSAPRLRLATLVTMRWLALTGQTLAIVIVYFGLGLDLPLIPAMAVELLSGALNVVVALVRAEPAWLGSREGSAMLGFDLVQLAILPYHKCLGFVI